MERLIEIHTLGEKAIPATEPFFTIRLLILIMLTALSMVIEFSLKSMEIAWYIQ